MPPLKRILSDRVAFDRFSPLIWQSRYYGHYSKVARGKRNKQDQDDLIPHILKRDGSSKEFRKSWARLIQKIGACADLIRKGRSPYELSIFASPETPTISWGDLLTYKTEFPYTNTTKSNFLSTYVGITLPKRSLELPIRKN